MDEETYVTTTQARKMLGFNPMYMAKVIREGRLETFPDPFDKRRKLIRLSDVRRLMKERLPRANPKMLARAS
jgi:hypothetical protein